MWKAATRMECPTALRARGRPRVFRTGDNAYLMLRSAGSCTRCAPRAVCGSRAPSGDVWYCIGTQCTGPRLCTRVPGGVDGAVDPFHLDRGVKRLGLRIVETHPGAPDRAADPQLGGCVCECL